MKEFLNPDSPVRFTRHARNRMRLRRVSSDEVHTVLVEHYRAYTDVRGNTVLIGRPNGRRIKVVVAVERELRVIITVGD